MGPYRLAKRARPSLRSFLYGTCTGTVTLFIGSGALVIGTCAGFLAIAQELQVSGGNGSVRRKNAGHLALDAYNLFIDPGQQTSEADNWADTVASKFKLLSVITFSLLGFIWGLMAFGVLVDRMGMMLQAMRRRHAMVAASDHILILGWTGKTLFLLRELAQMLTDSADHGGTLVVLGDLDVFDMREEVHVYLRDWNKRWPRVKVHYWRGKPHEVDDLCRVSAARSRHVIVLGTSRQPREADSLVISTLCALQCVPGKAKDGMAIVVEVAMPQNVEVARQLGGPRAHTITAKSAIDELVALSMRSALVGGSLIGLMTFDGDQFEVLDLT
jgi:hypothetical protein